MVKVPRGTETGDAPGWQGARSENTGQYLNDEQRRQAGCSAGRMQRDFHHGLLELDDKRGLEDGIQLVLPRVGRADDEFRLAG